MPAQWFQLAATELASVWERKPDPSGAVYSLFASSLPCYHYPEKPSTDAVVEFGEVAVTVYVWVFDEEQVIPRQCCITSGGVAYISIDAPVKTESVGGGQGGNVQVRTHISAPPPNGVTV